RVSTRRCSSLSSRGYGKTMLVGSRPANRALASDDSGGAWSPPVVASRVRARSGGATGLVVTGFGDSVAAGRVGGGCVLTRPVDRARTIATGPVAWCRTL